MAVRPVRAASPWRPAVAPGALVGVVLAAVGWLLPWFTAGVSGPVRSGLRVLDDEDPTVPIALVAVAFVAAAAGAFWAGREPSAAAVVLVATVGVCGLTAVMVAAALIDLVDVAADDDRTDTVVIGPGVPVMCLGLGLVLASAVWALVADLLREERESRRRPATRVPSGA